MLDRNSIAHVLTRDSITLEYYERKKTAKQLTFHAIRTLLSCNLSLIFAQLKHLSVSQLRADSKNVLHQNVQIG